jgi:4-hydroxythreonine-4-phosphate dehydrogenase
MSRSKNDNTPVIGITLGDINGIGPEVVIKSLSDSRMLDFFTPVIYGSSKVISFYRKQMKADQFSFITLNDDHPAHRKINVCNCWDEMIPIDVGQITEAGGTASYKALEKSVKHLKEGVIDALVTGPINKDNIQQEKFTFAGHTEYFAARFETRDSLMFMVSDTLRIGVVTGHLPLKDVASTITTELLTHKLEIMEASLRNDFNIEKPKIAVLGLNPHAGENGLLGTEEDEIISPVIKSFKQRGVLMAGPFPADGFFGKGDYRKFDGIMAMYHDQGLVPFKALTFQNGVNYTAGLPIIRTSPDHGTAYSLVGKKKASENSMRAALFMAYDIYKCRKERNKPQETTIFPA